MNKKTFFMRAIVLAALILCTYYGLRYANINKPLTSSDDCDFTTGSCTFTLNNKTIGLSFVQAPVTEEELFIKFTIPKGLSLQKVWIEGTDMYMGKTPVMFEDPERPYIGVTFLGSCNLAEMKWALYIEVAESDINANKNVANKSDANKNTDNTVLSASFSTYLH